MAAGAGSPRPTVPATRCSAHTSSSTRRAARFRNHCWAAGGARSAVASFPRRARAAEAVARMTTASTWASTSTTVCRSRARSPDHRSACSSLVRAPWRDRGSQLGPQHVQRRRRRRDGRVRDEDARGAQLVRAACCAAPALVSAPCSASHPPPSAKRSSAPHAPPAVRSASSLGLTGARTAPRRPTSSTRATSAAPRRRPPSATSTGTTRSRRRSARCACSAPTITHAITRHSGHTCASLRPASARRPL